MKERYLWIGLFIVICSMFGNHLYYQSKLLTEPIFLEHYYETYVVEGNQLDFYYLSNNTEPVDVSYVTIDDVVIYPTEVSGFAPWIDQTHNPTIKQRFTHHNLKFVTLQLPSENLPINEGSEDVWTFEEMEVTFTNGQTIIANIGEVRVYGKLSRNDALNNTYSSASNQNFSEWLATATKSLTIEGISIPFSDPVREDIFIKLLSDSNNTTQDEIDTYSQAPSWYNEKFLADRHLNKREGVSLTEELFPIHLNELDFIKLYMYFNPESRIEYDFYVTIYGSEDNGEYFEYAVPINSNNIFNLTQQDVNKIIEERQGGLSQ